MLQLMVARASMKEQFASKPTANISHLNKVPSLRNEVYCPSQKMPAKGTLNHLIG
jgi:hypothetical protein